MMRKWYLIFSIVIMTATSTGALQAQSTDEIQQDLNAVWGNSTFYGGGPEARSCGSGAQAIGGTNAEAIMNYFLQQGLEPFQAAGIVGNLHHESGLDPLRAETTAEFPGYQTFSSMDEVTSGRGFGLAQWTTAGRQNNWREFAESTGQDPLSLQLQLDFLWEEMTVLNPDFYNFEGLLATSNEREAAWIFLAFFERPGAVIDDPQFGGRDNYNPTDAPPTSGPASSVLDTRTDFAQSVLREYGGGRFSACGSSLQGATGTDLTQYASQFPEFRNGRMTEATAIALHWTAGSSTDGENFADIIAGREGVCCSVQFYVNGDGEVFQYVDPIDTITGHISSWNRYAIGIEISAGSDGTVATAEREIMSQPAQRAAVEELVLFLSEEFEIPLLPDPTFPTDCDSVNAFAPVGLIGHIDYPCSDKVDPSRAYLELVRENVRARATL